MSKLTVWDKISPVYDAVETACNSEVFSRLGERVAEHIYPCDDVLECACGTGAISIAIARKCRRLTATDMSPGMLRQCERKLRSCYNVRLRKADIMHLKCPDNRFDKVVAGNVIHLLEDPEAAVNELLRVCKPGGSVIIPTYINIADESGDSFTEKALGRIGIKFSRCFTADSYRRFFEDIGHPDAEITVIKGRVPCALAVLVKD